MSKIQGEPARLRWLMIHAGWPKAVSPKPIQPKIKKLGENKVRSTFVDQVRCVFPLCTTQAPQGLCLRFWSPPQKKKKRIGSEALAPPPSQIPPPLKSIFSTFQMIWNKKIYFGYFDLYAIQAIQFFFLVQKKFLTQKMIFFGYFDLYAIQVPAPPPSQIWTPP